MMTDSNQVLADADAREFAALKSTFTPEEWEKIMANYAPERLLQMKRELERIERREALDRALNYKEPRSEGGKA